MLIPFVPEPKDLVKVCIERAKKRARQTRGFNKESTKRKREYIRVESLATCLSSRLSDIVKGTANFDRLNPFYMDLVPTVIDLASVKKALAVINWLASKIDELGKDYRRKMRRARDVGEVTRIRKQFEARVEDLLMSNQEEFTILKKASGRLERLPKIKEMPTVILAGYPNVGKSSILKALTGSDVEIKSYPFTTKQILVGYATLGYNQIQLVDTPGLLDRPVEFANQIEKQALAALRHLSDKVLFILDPSESCGYPIKDQLSLLESLKKQGLDIMVVANKADIKKPDFDVDMVVSALNPSDMERLKRKVFSWLGFPVSP